MTLFSSPYPPYDPTDKTSFSYETVVKRWPIIITGVIDQLYKECHILSLESQTDDGHESTLDLEVKLSEGKNIIEKLSKLKYQMGRDHPLDPVRAIVDDGGSLVDVYNQELDRLAGQNKNTWFTAPWLFAELVKFFALRLLIDLVFL
ncbi:hypothetical protein H0H93_001702 [Arthromyces matolae]|nr:hypothetical protein H0H93_001702 [Arthromyces matolae]